MKKLIKCLYSKETVDCTDVIRFLGFKIKKRNAIRIIQKEVNNTLESIFYLLQDQQIKSRLNISSNPDEIVKNLLNCR